MSRATIIIRTNQDRVRATDWVARAPEGTRLDFKSVKRTLPQNDRMWSMLTDVAHQLPWHGKKLTAADWKLIFLDALKREARMVPGIDGGYVSLGRSSSDLSKQEMSDLIELMHEFGARHGVKFGDISDLII